jgi:hypothetical protein
MRIRSNVPEHQQGMRRLSAPDGRGDEMALLAICHALSAKGGNASAIATELGLNHRLVSILKADIAGMGTTGDTSALADYISVANGFAAFLASAGFFDGALADMKRAPLHSRYKVVTSAPVAAETDERMAKLPGRMSLASEFLRERKATALVAMSLDLLRFSDNVELVRDALRTAVIQRTDGIFISALSSGAATIAASGLDAAGIRSDLRRALDLLSLDAQSRVWIAMSAPLLARLTVLGDMVGAPAFPNLTLAGGEIGGMEIRPSDATTADVFLVDASGLVANSDAVEIRSSTEGTIELDDASAMSSGAGSPPAPVSANLVSLFQGDGIALLAERFFGFEPIRDGAAVVITGAASTWGLEGSPPA